MNKVIIATLVLVITTIAVPVSALDTDKIEIGGSALGLGFFLNQDDEYRVPMYIEHKAQRQGFDFGVNLDLSMTLTEELVFGTQLQMGPGNGPFGIVGPGAEVTDIYFEYAPREKNLSFVFGSFDTPFGEETGNLSNNGDTFANNFIFNSLLYSAFAGPVGTLNTLGVMGTWSHDMVEATVAITNGTDESASNDDGNMEYVARVGFYPGTEMIRLAGSYLHSYDKAMQQSTGFGMHLSGFLGEVFITPVEGLFLKGYVGQLKDESYEGSYVDYLGGDEGNTILLWMGELSYEFKQYTLAIQASGWNPEDNNGNGSPIFPAFTPGLSNVDTYNDQDIMRVQGSLIYKVNDDVMLRLNPFMDKYSEEVSDNSTDVLGIVGGINVRF